MWKRGRLIKKLVSTVLVLVVLFSLCTTVFADYQLYDIASTSDGSMLNITGTTATCISKISILDTNVSSVKITQTLEKQGFLWIWGTYDGPWTKTLTKSGNLTTKVYNLPRGTYRVKSVFVITLKDNISQTITLYSDTKKCDNLNELGLRFRL